MKYSTQIKDWGEEKLRENLVAAGLPDPISITFALRPNVIEVDMPRELTEEERGKLNDILEQDERAKSSRAEMKARLDKLDGGKGG